MPAEWALPGEHAGRRLRRDRGRRGGGRRAHATSRSAPTSTAVSASEQTPDELDTIADHARIGEALAARGWGADDVAGVLGGNWLRVLGGLYA